MERFWLPAGETYSLTGGWLADPDTTNRFYVPNSRAAPTDGLAAYRCVVLLGEPGMGKTSTLKTRGDLVPPGARLDALHVDLGRYSSEERLARRVFENETMAAWVRGDNTLCLTLDSFDEAHNRIGNLHQMLAGYLDDWDCERLLIRIACRTADWPSSLRLVLERKFDDANVHELLPLRRKDAARLLEADGVDADTFLEAIEVARVVPLAARPLTLNLLRAGRRADGSLPSRGAELYARGLLTLADELNPERRDAIRSMSSASERLDAATRMAAVSVFGGRPTVWMGATAQAESSDVTIEDCAWSDAGTGIPILSFETLGAALRTGLFTGAGENRLGWAHATFADFLAARWISTADLNEAQVRNVLLAHDGRIHPRVRQVAAWLVALEPDKFGWLIPCDSEAFLSNVDIPEDDLRRCLVDAICADARDGRLYYDHFLDFTGLGHDLLPGQLRAVLADAIPQVVDVAIGIARQCSVTEVVPELTALAINEATNPSIRVSAAMAVHDLSVDDPSHELVRLLDASSSVPAGGLDSWELEAAALIASWPHAISTAEVFDLLNPRHPRNYAGLYSIFINDFAKRLTSDDLPIACDWLMADSARLNDRRVSPLVNAIVWLCLKHLDHPKARDATKQVLIERAEHHEPLFGDDALTRDAPTELEIDDRRALARLFLESATDDQVFSILDSFGGHGLSLVTGDDLGWLIEQYPTADGALKENIKTAVSYIYAPTNVAHSDLALGLPDDHPAAELFSYWRSVTELDSPEATTAREAWREHAEQRQQGARRQADEARDRGVNPRIAEDAHRARLGDLQAFWYAVRLVTVRPGTLRHMDEHQPDLTAHPRWATLPDDARRDLLEAAPTYLREARCEPERWLGQNLHFYPAEAAYRAMILLLRLQSEELSQFPGGVWREWAPILVSRIAIHDGARVDDMQALFELAIPHARDELTTALLALIDKAITEDKPSFLREELSLLDTEFLAVELVERLKRPIGSHPRDEILDALMENHTDLARPVLHSWLAPQQRVDDHDRACAAVVRLLRSDTEHSWPVLRDLMDTDPEFMESAVLSLGYYYGSRPLDLIESQCAELYIWLTRHFPPGQDPQFEDVHPVGPRESIGVWRDSLLDALRRRGTKAAVQAVEQIRAEFPEKDWLTYTLAQAQHSYRERTWEPLGPTELGQLAGSRRARVVRTDEDLINAALDALQVIQQRLQEDTPSSRLLWDTFSARPKAEDEISDFLKSELEQRLNQHGAVVNREVQVRRNRPTGLPERTDLRIEAMPPRDSGATGPVRIPGEVKGAWNPDILNSMDNQLGQRYMTDLQTDRGLYIVAWFDLDSWTDEDPRKRRAAAYRTRDQLLAILEERAKQQTQKGRKVAVVVLDASLRRPRIS